MSAIKKGVIRFSIIIPLIGLLLAFVAVPALAFDARGGQDITIGSGEVINSDLYLGGTNITIDGTVNGDVFAMGQNITINGSINGGVSLAAQTVIVNGNVSAGARIGGQTVRVGGSIGRDLIVAASELTVINTAVIGGDLNSFAGNTVIDGRVTGNVTGSMNNLTITDGVNGNVTVRVDTLRIASTANIQGNVNYTSRNTANIEPGSTIGGTTNRTEPPKDTPRRGIRAGIAGAILFGIWGYLAIFIIGLVVLALARRFIFRLATAIRDYPLSSLGWGALLFFVTPVAAVAVMFTVIGIPLGLLTLIIWGILLYIIQIPVALLVGWLILSRRRDNLSFGLLVGCLALGLLILYAVGAIPVFGWLIRLLIIIFGLGSLIAVWRATNTITQTSQTPRE